MKHLILPDDKQRILPFYLAMEEYATTLNTGDDIFFLWQVQPTVIFGRNQLIDNEVNVDYCRENNIAMYRRRSGGGCVFADMSNIMFSYITRSDNVETTFRKYTSKVVEMLCSLGLNASDSSRNDILINGLKVSGNAFYHLSGHSIVHGTMLYDTDFTHISNAITPRKDKLQSNGVESVTSRITTLNRHLTMPIEEFKRYTINYMTDENILLDRNDVKAIEQITQKYLTDEFIYGKNPRYNKTCRKRIDGVGELQINLEIKGLNIVDLNIAGDYFLVGDVDNIISRLKGTKMTEIDVRNSLNDIQLNNVIMGLTIEKFLSTIFD